MRRYYIFCRKIRQEHHVFSPACAGDYRLIFEINGINFPLFFIDKN